ncbi:MAG: DnaJ domain-containing protein [Lactobacillaceae bacterium]|jgi:hypothetical protein|nr:DnaJ domain-containing protein [Lactobacillaceae bacterium]
MKKTKHSKKYFAPQTEDTSRICDFEGCTCKGEYKAPKDRSLKDYYWFCLDHVQAYNSKWNYYEGISTDAPEEGEDFDLHFKGFGPNVKYNFMGDFDNYNNDFSFLYTKEELKYFEIMDIKPGEATLELIKKQYKKLVKKYHPDMNQGDKEMEEKFKRLSVAYKYLLNKFT